MADRRVETMDLKGQEYARVPQRLKMFREDCPRGKIETDYINLGDGTVEFIAWVWKDKADYMEILKAVKDTNMARGSADSVGHSKGSPTEKKDFEKQETIAIGRALAILGYLASGEVASSEEMEEYYKEKDKKRQEDIEGAIGLINATTTMDELKKTFLALDNKAEPEVVKAKDEQKLVLRAVEIELEKAAKKEAKSE